ncbi:hydroxyacid dehydrogenase [Actinospica sp. MGRD01-02]|uniref:Hydroxyacid dehydrogenase n=1 Tax=Actinospica acidithermotolerans TaxID=2828514 RepID=A0A941E9R9_9ACTN|nr:hydroxyacid dehydrogenase [Actinospica acidithermotolerans]MBR7828860.1 hydroxyacid dehydrogenase [Actinospica acidithermotolerans]
MPARLKALFAMSPEHLPLLFPEPVMARLTSLVDIDPGLVAHSFADAASAAALADADVLITSWGCPPLEADVLARAPRLTTLVHAAGSVKYLANLAARERNLAISSAADANAVPVAEYTLGAILLAGKGAFELRESYARNRGFVIAQVEPGVGNYGRRVGIVGASRIGRRVIELLRPHDLEVCVYDPYVQLDDVRQVSLGELLETCDVVSLHAPLTAETRHMIGADELARIRDGAVLINTARGELVDTVALIAQLETGRISALLDVTHPEPLPADSVLFDLPNVFLTPHIAGSQGNELARLGTAAVDEVERLAANLPLAHRVDLETLGRAA